MADRRGIAARAALAREDGVAREDGFTLIELMVAIMVMAVGLIALVTSFDHSRDLVSVAEKTEVATHRAERELERILAMPYDSVAHPSVPASSGDSSAPASFVSGNSYQYDQGSTGPESETLVAPTTGGPPTGGSVGVTPQPWNETGTRLTGQMQSFVTWTGEDDYCTAADRTLCAKRVTVAVTVGGPSPLRRPVLISTVMTSPVGP